MSQSGKIRAQGDKEMSLDKSIKNGRREWRKRWYGKRSFDPACRNNKGCPGCKGNRESKMRRQGDREKGVAEGEGDGIG